MKRGGSVHNTHMLLPKELYIKVRELAALEGTTVTRLVVEALDSLLRRRKKK